MTDRQGRPAGTRSIEAIQDDFRTRNYIADRSVATAVFLALELGRPLLLEGEAGVGKTELAKVLAASLDTRLIRLQCYEGLDVNTAVYEWNYPRQMLEIRLLEARGEADHATAHDIFGSDFLIRRPLLQALEASDGSAPVLLIDEIDRADEEFEAYLLEILSDFQVTVPEIGTIRAETPPRVILTSNRTREVHDALKRRCLYHWIDYPTAQKEYEIVLAKVPESPERLAREVVGFVHRLREADLTKVPGIAETLDWAAALYEWNYQRQLLAIEAHRGHAEAIEDQIFSEKYLLERPLLLEGEAGVGKTEVAKALAGVHASELIRLQCYEGLDQNAALYEWNYQRQLLAIKAREGIGEEAERIEEHIFSERYLLELPLLAAIRRETPPVLLIDEIDRADEEFEAFLLELLSDFQVSIPELGTIKARVIPRVVLTSNGTRELSDALRRRCLYHYVDFPEVDREARIILAHRPDIDTALALQVARMVAAVRKEDLRKVPGVAETLDWAATLAGLDVHDLRQEPEAVYETMICLLKTREDRAQVSREVSERLLGKVA